MSTIDDGTGGGYWDKSNANKKMYTSAKTQTEKKAVTRLGDSYTIASGVVSEYVKNEKRIREI